MTERSDGAAGTGGATLALPPTAMDRNAPIQPLDGHARRGALATALDGVIGGVIGTATMSLLMLAARRAGLVSELPPERITAAALDALDVKQRPRLLQDALAALVHFTFGGVRALFSRWRRAARACPSHLTSWARSMGR